MLLVSAVRPVCSGTRHVIRLPIPPPFSSLRGLGFKQQMGVGRLEEVKGVENPCNTFNNKDKQNLWEAGGVEVRGQNK